MKKIISLVLALGMAVPYTGTALSVSAAEVEQPSLAVISDVERSKETYGDFEYALTSDGTVRIFNYIGDGGDVKIPEYIDEIPVTRISAMAFEGCTRITGVELPNSITHIGMAAFIGCTDLTSITIPNSVASIGDYVFIECTNLTSIDVDADNQNYCSQDGVLFNKDKTELIQFPEGKGGDYAIPDSVESIAICAFVNCTSLTSIEIPYGVKSIGNAVFQNCTSLTSVELPNSATGIGDFAFDSCTSLTRITIPDSVTSIGKGAFEGCEKLTIFGKAGSYAETYANDNNIPFKALSDTTVELLMGDLNNDGRVTPRDAFALQRSIAGLLVLTDEQKLAADVTGDGKFNSLDCLSIQRYAAGVEVNNPVGKLVEFEITEA